MAMAPSTLASAAASCAKRRCHGSQPLVGEVVMHATAGPAKPGLHGAMAPTFALSGSLVLGGMRRRFSLTPSAVEAVVRLALGFAIACDKTMVSRLAAPREAGCGCAALKSRVEL